MVRTFFSSVDPVRARAGDMCRVRLKGGGMGWGSVRGRCVVRVKVRGGGMVWVRVRGGPMPRVRVRGRRMK